ncbi:Erd1p [Ascoidea rubescens DSM 1968]|uniref:EXS-domain-containing protein n=1 Tax=Ascoidea rubescens DSM 1968 TaxID=1344418 RepID=A0A1D2VPG1_9ASCO|nr:EXS-domain-containing protein [Ascoidea rubescens DSM 1968]ODV63503.1 EXS-domain-containing protein [Ascoidea rubescens DSM 1968]
MMLDLWLPLPYRIVFFVVLGVWLWWLNLHICQLASINTNRLLQLLAAGYGDEKLLPNDPEKEPQLEKGCLVVFRHTLCIALVSYLCFLLLPVQSTGDTLLRFKDFIPLLTMLLIFVYLLNLVRLPLLDSEKSSANLGRKRLLSTFKRIICGNINYNQLRTNDILLSDTLTSYSKILLDFFLYLFYLYHGQTCFPTVDDKLQYNLNLDRSIFNFKSIEPLFLIFPQFIRLKQCWLEYNHSNKRNNQHLLNFLKYSSNLIPIFLNSLLNYSTQYSTRLQIAQLYIFSMFLNSVYTFIWDVAVDWNFNFFNFFLKSHQNFNKPINLNRPKLLRNILVYKIKHFYYLAILLDFILRFFWLFNLFISDLFFFNSESGYFLLELFELIRRCIWCFIKLETEWAKISYNDPNLIVLDTLESQSISHNHNHSKSITSN